MKTSIIFRFTELGGDNFYFSDHEKIGLEWMKKMIVKIKCFFMEEKNQNSNRLIL